MQQVTLQNHNKQELNYFILFSWMLQNGFIKGLRLSYGWILKALTEGLFSPPRFQVSPDELARPYPGPIHQTALSRIMPFPPQGFFQPQQACNGTRLSWAAPRCGLIGFLGSTSEEEGRALRVPLTNPSRRHG